MRMRPGAHLDERYRLGDRIATGGVGEVWKAVDESTGRPVAVKVLRDRHVGDDGFRERFRAEAKHTAALSHPGLAEVFDYVEDGPLAYLVMEYLTGRPLSVLLSGGRELGARLTLGIVGQVAVTLQAAHEAGVVHRDIKPDNLIVGYDGQVKVTDFGIARGANMATLTQPGVVIGTAVYMSPEQAEAQRVAAASDIYSLGVVCYECLAGRVPFVGSTPVEIAFGHVREQPPDLPAYVPRALRDLVGRCLAKDPAERPATMAEVAEVAYSIAQTLTPAVPRTPLPIEVAALDTSSSRTGQRGRHRAASRWRQHHDTPSFPGPGRLRVGRSARIRRLPAAAGAGLGRATHPASTSRPLGRRRAVVASLAGTTVLASGLVLGAQIGFFSGLAPYRDADAMASPTPAAPAPPDGTGLVAPRPSISALHTETPPAGRGANRTVTSSTPSPSGSSASPSLSGQPSWPAPSRRMEEATPTPTAQTSPGMPSSSAPSPPETPTPTPPESEDLPDDEGEPDDDTISDEERSQATAAPSGSRAEESASPTLTTPIDGAGSGNPSLEGAATPSPEPQTPTPTDDVGLNLGPVDVSVDLTGGGS